MANVANIEQLLNTIDALTVIELAEVVSALETKYGVSAAMVAGAAAAPAEAAAPVEAKSEFKVELIDSGNEKLKVIKALRTIRKDLGLGDAKNAAENPPFLIAEAAPKEEAENMKKVMEEAGAKVKLS